MTRANDEKGPQGGGELSGLLRRAEQLQQELDRALAELKSESVEAHDAARLVTIRMQGNGSAPSVKLNGGTLSDTERRHLEEALNTALRIAIERMFELRKTRVEKVTRGLALPGLFT